MRKVIIAIALIACIFFIVYRILKKDDKDKIWDGNKVSAQLFDKDLDESIGSVPDSAEIYIDPSASMKPYFISERLTMVNSLAKIRTLHGKENTPIYFLGNKNPCKGTVNDILSNVGAQPSKAHSTFHDFFKEHASKLDKDKIVYLVTDGIMSIGNDDMNKELEELEGEITNSLRGHGNLAIAVLRYVGDFNPVDKKKTYFNSRNQPVMEFSKIPRHRPYYIIAIGTKDAIRALKSKSSELLKPQASLYLGIHDGEGHRTKGKMSLKKLQSQTDSITLEMRLPSCLKEEIESANIVVLNNGKKLAVNLTKEDDIIRAIIPAYVVLKENLDSLRTTSVIMQSKKVDPSDWFVTFNTNDDITNGPDSITTFGLKHLIGGISKALEPDSIQFQMEFKFLR